MIGYLLPEYTIVNNDEIYLTVCQTIIQVKMKYQYKCQIINTNAKSSTYRCGIQ